MTLPEFVLKDLGFESEKEMSDLIARVDLNAPGAFEAFDDWRQNDGSKAGLEGLLEKES